MQKVILDLLPGGVAPIVYASQYDDGRSIRFMLTEGGPDNQYSLNSSDVITCNLTKPDGTETVINVANPGGGEHYVDLVNGADDYDQAGAYLGEIVLTRNSRVIGSANFVLKVEEDAYGGQITTLTATGNPCTFDTDLADTLVSLTADIVANQDLHGYDHPWAGGAGKNKIEGRSTATTEHDITVTPKGDGTFDVNGMASANCYILISSTALASGSYILNGDVSGFGTDMYLYCMPSYNRGTFTSNVEGVYLYVKSGTAVNHATIKPMVRLSTETDPTFAPYSNICPIVGHSELNLTRCGKNLLDKTTGILQDMFINQSNMKISSIGATGASIYCPIIGGNTYTVSKVASAQFSIATTKTTPTLGVDVFDYVSNNSATHLTLTADADAKYLVIFFYFANYDTKTQNEILDTIQVELGSTATAYEPYNGQTFTIAFGQTVYGGLYDKSGRLTITWGAVDLGSLTWIAAITNVPGKVRMRAALTHKAIPDSEVFNAKCDIYTAIAASQTYLCVDGISGENTGSYIFVYDDNYSTSADLPAFISMVNGHYLAYELATPIVIDVTAISVFAENGTNNIVSDCLGDVSVTYIKKV